jgi:hypothetical protein
MMILWTNGLLIKSWMQPMGRANGATTNFCATMYGHSTLNGSPEGIEGSSTSPYRAAVSASGQAGQPRRVVEPRGEQSRVSSSPSAYLGASPPRWLPAASPPPNRPPGPLKNASSNGATQPDRYDSEGIVAQASVGDHKVRWHDHPRQVAVASRARPVSGHHGVA